MDDLLLLLLVDSALKIVAKSVSPTDNRAMTLSGIDQSSLPCVHKV